jgi:hypothetical protein
MSNHQSIHLPLIIAIPAMLLLLFILALYRDIKADNNRKTIEHENADYN